MNRTNLIPLVVLLSLAAAAIQAHADTDRDGAPTARSTLARSDVLADLEVWQSSGLAGVEQGEATDRSAPRYRTALAVYQAMREPKAFGERVVRIARERGETLLMADR